MPGIQKEKEILSSKGRSKSGFFNSFGVVFPVGNAIHFFYSFHNLIVNPNFYIIAHFHCFLQVFNTKYGKSIDGATAYSLLPMKYKAPDG